MGVTIRIPDRRCDFCDAWCRSGKGGDKVDRDNEKYDAEGFVKADTVITAMGMKPRRDAALSLYNCAKDFYLIGDARAAKDIREANWDGYQAAFDIGRI